MVHAIESRVENKHLIVVKQIRETADMARTIKIIKIKIVLHTQTFCITKYYQKHYQARYLVIHV
jgi:hypothetical protein